MRAALRQKIVMTFEFENKPRTVSASDAHVKNKRRLTFIFRRRRIERRLCSFAKIFPRACKNIKKIFIYRKKIDRICLTKEKCVL